MILSNSQHESITFKLPARDWGYKWVKVLDTAKADFKEEARPHRAGGKIQAQSRSLVVMRRRPE